VGLFSKLFGNQVQKQLDAYFKTLTAYTPVFTTFEGGVYEMELTRAVIHSFANSASKLKPEKHGAAKLHLESILQFQPNPFMDTGKFLYRIATILSVNNNCFIVPIEDEYGTIEGYYPILPANVELMDRGGVAYLRFTFASGEKTAIEYSKVGHLTQYQFEDDFFGSSNAPLKHTMQLIHAQNQGIVNAIKNSAIIRFIAKIANKISPEKVREERDRFSKENFTADNESGLIVHDATFTDFQQLESKPYTVNAAQMKLIKDNVFDYFGTNETILQNKFNEEQWAAYYSGKIEPFAIQLSLALTNMTFTKKELAHGNRILLTANRLQHASNKTKMEFSTSLIDRGVVVPNEARELWGLPAIEGGDERIIRRDYVKAAMMDMRDREIQESLDNNTETDDNAGGESDANVD
jgi:HK97 family phage portal protein